MATSQEKNYKRNLARDRMQDLDFNNGQSLEDRLQDKSAASLSMADQNQGRSAGNKTSGAMARQLSQDRLQDKSAANLSMADQNQATSSKDATQTDKDGDKGSNSLRGRWQKIKNLKKSTSGKLQDISNKGKQAQEMASRAANMAIKKAWNQAHLITEEALLDIFYLAFIFALPYLLICFLRWFVATIGMLQIKIKGIYVNLVPQYALSEVGTRIGANVVFLLIAAIEWILIALVVWAIMHPVKAAWEALWYVSGGGLFDIVWGWFF